MVVPGNASDRPLNRKLALQILAVAAGAALLIYAANRASRTGTDASGQPTSFDAIVVGSGISGLSAALELANGGASVVIVDMASVFGGHAVMATGDLCLVDTPYQRERGIVDSPAIAYKDFVDWGEDPDPMWTRRYVETSGNELYDWLTSMGVTFETMIHPPGNSVLRTHRSKGRGIGLVSPIYTECARRPNVAFRWNTQVERLLIDGGRVVGVATKNTRTGATGELRAPVTVMATGGFQSNLDMVRASWPADKPFPERFLIGAGINALGTGHKVAQAAGAALTRLDHQWNYITGLPDPRFPPESHRGLNAYNEWSIWVNADAKRFVAERASAKFAFPLVTQQKGSSFWSVFDEGTKRKFWVAGSDWASFDAIEKQIFANPALMKSANTIEELAAKIGLPPAELRATVDKFNAQVDKGVDEEFGHFGPGKTFKPQRIDHPPYYASQHFPLTRKSAGGVAIDRTARVLDANEHVIPGLYAVGELTGVAGINGKHALEGTFLGPSMLTGRVAGRAMLMELASKKAAPPPLPVVPPAPPSQNVAPACLGCHQLPALVKQNRPGYWHFERVHAKVLERQYDCSKCHAELGTLYDVRTHHIDRLTQPRVCTTCHSGEDVAAAAPAAPKP
jgi:flavocytochrome c